MTTETKTRKKPVRLTNDEMIADLKRVAKKVRGNLGVHDYAKHGRVTPQTICKAFGSWNKAKAAAELSTRGKGRPSKQIATLAEAATVVLKHRTKHGLTAKQIADKIAAKDLMPITAKNPVETVRKALKASDLFVKLDNGKYVSRVETPAVEAPAEQVATVEAAA